MADLLLIPLSGVNETFGIALSDTLTLRMRVTWRNRGGSGWALDLAAEDGTPLVSGLPLITGADLIEQHRHIGIPGSLFVLSLAGNPLTEPTFANLGTDVNLYYVPDDT